MPKDVINYTDIWLLMRILQKLKMDFLKTYTPSHFK